MADRRHGASAPPVRPITDLGRRSRPRDAQAITENSQRLGKRLMFEHDGRFSARRGPYRIIYELREEERFVRVLAIGHRRDVHRPR